MTQEVVKEQYHIAKTKSGIEIRYEDSTHSYWVRGPAVDEDDVAHGGQEWIPCTYSMSGVSDCLAKNLSWWGMQIGQRSVLTLWEQGFIRPSIDGKLAAFGAETWEYATPENVEALSKKQSLTVNHIRDKAGDRGNSVHKALETWVADGTIPVPEFFPETERGYVIGLTKFITDLGTLKSKPESEIMVGSLKHKVAGRYDLEAVLHETSLVTKPASPKWDPTPGATNHHSAKPEERTVFNGRTLFDVKTSKGVYLGHKIQMTGYEMARVECGMAATKQQIVVRVGDNGTYQAVVVDTTEQDFLDVLAVARLTTLKGSR